MNGEMRLLEIIRQTRDALGLPESVKLDDVPMLARDIAEKAQAHEKALGHIKTHLEQTQPKVHTLSAVWCIAKRALERGNV